VSWFLAKNRSFVKSLRQDSVLRGNRRCRALGDNTELIRSQIVARQVQLAWFLAKNHSHESSAHDFLKQVARVPATQPRRFAHPN
jgi:hypothetical protein